MNAPGCPLLSRLMEMNLSKKLGENRILNGQVCFERLFGEKAVQAFAKFNMRLAIQKHP
jgi:hypothetical protein